MITDEIVLLADAFKARGLDQAEETPFANPKNDRQRAANAFINATVLVEALNEGRKPNYADPKEERIEVWWYMRPKSAGGPGFSYDGFGSVSGSSLSTVGARLVFFDRKVAKYAVTQFREVFEPFMTFPEE